MFSMEFFGRLYQVFIFTALVVGLAFVLKLVLPDIARTCAIYRTKDQAECVQIIAGKVIYGITNTLTVLESRARVNKRLIDTFGINNAFTTKDSRRHNDHKTEVGVLLKPDWIMVARTAREQARKSHSGNLVCLVQSLVLKMSVKVLFGRDPSKLDSESVSFIAAEINRMWTNSKVPRHTIQWEKQYRLHEALQRVVPDCDPLDPQRNAMNLILPAFETMWRVVLRCFVEVGYRGAVEKEEWIGALKAYLEYPSLLSDRTCEDNAHAAIVRYLVSEGLRLYPPTRHIHRHFESVNGTTTLAIADIEGLHRNAKIWGTDADLFKPSRWKNAGVESWQWKAWMPFGASPLTCPAKPDFGPRMIGILVAALVAAFCDEAYELLEEDLHGHVDIAEFVGPLRCERDAYERLFLKRNEPCA
ncbi:hypothetical protein NX059_012122 [Plenodomus lindquistii]|nr:hypothetical protein NX059_012122 [Plenodomus lindquistii]